MKFVGALNRRLKASGITTWIDREGLRASEKWLPGIRSAIVEADSFVFVISAGSIGSRMCRLELNHAVKLGKRIIPILLDPDSKMPRGLQFLRAVQWIHGSERNFLGKLIEALQVNPEFLHTHARLTEQAKRWEDERDG